MKTVDIEVGTLDTCVQDAQQERVMITRKGVPIALIVGVEGLDDEQVALGSSDEFWAMISERRRQKAITREELERRNQISE